MKPVFCLTIVFVFLSACRQDATSGKENASDSSDSYAHHETELVEQYDTARSRSREGIYEFVYPDNTADLIENQYIKLIREQDFLTGKYYGTTDEFEEAREGYLPGFFVTDLDDLHIQGDSIEFAIQCSEDDFFTKPVDLQIQNSDEAKKLGYIKWKVKLRTNLKKCSGFFQGDTILLKDNLNERFYVRVK